MKAAQLGTATQQQASGIKQPPHGILVPATQLQEADVLCMTLAARARPHHDLASTPPALPQQTAPPSHAALSQGQLKRAAGSAASMSQGSTGGDDTKRRATSRSHGKVAPGSSRQSKQRQQQQQQWLVPAFNSVTGYEFGLYLEDQETVIFD
jgi:hypothetical protein